ncbi:PAS/PAC sensor hybrid histidine kinase [Pseudodesulfovibrio profundus]|uniref:histidine kinase n=1 Tax=Pseudodesulfovibrio profundus TaxID=57320 RepID=A0A2C8FFB5_9BACT|nr:ABC transporter substrate binding protein [Pseudodesulfovibrio profundus]SOB60740.1 PAS/PAC sensor hybrid histidine kinase [Pseudodesulfovibrio profundus]
MRKFYYSTIILMLLFVVPCAAAAEKEKKNILYLNSYHHGYEWSDAILEGVRSVLDESDYKINLQVEYMDVKRFSYDDVSAMLLRLYREKFLNENFDVVMVSDNDAYRFATENREELFPGVPLVFCGVNDFNATMLQDNVTGVEENFDLQLTLDVALKIHPNKKRMVVVGDKSTAGVTIRAQIEAVMPQYADRLDVEYWTDMTLEQVLDKLETLSSDSFLFFIPFYHSIKGQFYTAEETMQAIYKESTLPIYTAWEFLLGHGAVGGHMLSGFRHGQKAASMSLRILRGEEATAIPVLREPTGEYAFDYHALWRLNISQELLPKNSRIINAPSPFYELPKQLLWTMVIGFLIVLVVLFFLVITMLERRKVERKILDQLAFQETLMDAVPLLVSWKDREGRYLGTNQAFAEFFGFEHGDSVVSLSSNEVMRDPTHVAWATRADMQVITKQQAFRKVRRNLTDAEGNQAWLEINKVPIRDQAGNIVGVLSTAENITKEQDLEKQLLQSQKMEAIGTLAGGIAHDFNNILTSIINSTELAISDIEPDSVTSKDLLRVLKAARRGGRVVKQILAFSRPSTEGFRPTDVGSVVSEVLGLMEASMPGNIQVRSSIRSNLPMVHADPTQLHQVAMNLCTNAFHALRQEGGAIEAHVDTVLLDEEQARILSLEPGEYVLMAIQDDGPGIPPEIMDKIFDPFFTTKDKTEGTGLGLSVVHGIIRSHRGGLQVLSPPEGGTVFEIYLPKAEKEVIVGVDGAAAKARRWAHILFIEDDYDQLATTPRLLETMGYEVTAIGAPEDALVKVKGMSHLFDLVITDYDMPGMSGTQFASQLIELTPNLPVILVSGREDASAAAARLPNIKAVIIKPYDKDTLSAAISGVIDE